MATEQDLNINSTAVDKKALVSAALGYSYSAYEWGKTLCLAQIPAVERPLEYIEATVTSTTTDVLKRAALTPSDLVASLDTKTFEFVEYCKVEEKFDEAKLFGAKKLHALKGEEPQDADKILAEEIELQQLIADAREVAWERVAGLQTQATDKVDTVIDAAETYVDKVLPAGDETEDEAEEEGEVTTRVGRLGSISATASRRFKKRLSAKLAGVTLKLREARESEPIVHLDLVRYAELLDLAAVRERVNTVGESLKTTESFAVVKGFVVKASAEAEKIKDAAKAKSDELAAATEARVVLPAKEYYATATAEFIKISDRTEKMFAEGRITAEEYVARVKAALGEAWTDKLYKPTLGFFEFCKVASNGVYQTYLEGKESAKLATAPDGTPYTLENGLEALVSAIQLRLSAEWEERVLPAVQKMRAKAGFTAAEEEKGEVFVDASE